MNKFLRAEPGGAKNFSPLPNTISSLSLSAGKLAVSDILAHYNASLTLDTYAHIAQHRKKLPKQWAAYSPAVFRSTRSFPRDG